MSNSEFYGRETYLETLQKRTKGIKEGYRQNIAIIGDKDVGKTSTILHFLNHFNDPMILPIYLELRPEYSQEQFVRKFIGVLLYNFLENSDIERSENLDFLISKVEVFIPKTVGAIKLILNSLKKKGIKKTKGRDSILIQLLALCDSLHSETEKSCVVIFDEFHNLGSLGIRQVYKQFSKMLMIQKNVLYIITSSAKYKAKKILSSHLALLFGNFEIIDMQPFNLATTERWLNKRFSGYLKIEKGLVDFLINFTGGCPLYINIICNSLLKSLGTITKERLAEVIQDLIFIEPGILNQRFNNYLSCLENLKLAQDYKDLLYLIADGQNKLKDFTTLLHKPKAQILSRLGLLLEYDVISKSGDFFVICDRIFASWLRFVYREKLQSFNFNTEEQKRNFRTKIEHKIEGFILSNRKSMLERMTELLQLFENELIQLRAKKIRLARFQEIKQLTFKYDKLSEGLLGRSKQSLWIMAIKTDMLTEEDISNFSSECQRLRYAKPQKRVIITQCKIDTNVRLKAMEEKVLTWDLDDVNSILDLYNKPRVIP